MKIVSWSFAVILSIIGVLNIFMVHPVPGIIYLLLALIYLPATEIFLSRRFGFKIPSVLKIILFVGVMWFMLGVGDLMELLESKWLNS